MSATPCETCDGTRLRPESLAVKIDMQRIADVIALIGATTLTLGSRPFADKLDDKRGRDRQAQILKEIRDRLSFLNRRRARLPQHSTAQSGTLSGGESQRIRLASQIGSGLTGVLYVLDEPSIGLHQRDNARLLDTLKRLRDLGNSVIVVEHDEDAIMTRRLRRRRRARRRHPRRRDRRRKARRGEIMADPKSLTGQYLTGDQAGCGAAQTAARRSPERKLTIVNARGNNLKNVSADVPLGLFTAITGVSAAAASRR